MEEQTSGYWHERTPEKALLLPKCSKIENEQDLSFFEDNYLLQKTNPEITAHIFSFLPVGPELCNFMRLEGFQPATDPEEASPFYPIVERIRNAHARYIFQHCEHKRHEAWSGRSDLRNAGSVSFLMSSLMETTVYGKKEDNTFFWSDIQELNTLIPENVSVDMLGAQEEHLKNVLKWFVVRTQKEAIFAADFFDNQWDPKKPFCIKKEKNILKEIYLKARVHILKVLVDRIESNLHWQNFDNVVIGNTRYPTFENDNGACGSIGCTVASMLTTGLFCGLHLPIAYSISSVLMSLLCGSYSTLLVSYVNWAKQKYIEQQSERDQVSRSRRFLVAACYTLQSNNQVKITRSE